MNKVRELLIIVLDCLDPLLTKECKMETLRGIGEIQTINTYDETGPAVNSLFSMDSKEGRLWERIDCKWGLCNIPYVVPFSINGWVIGGYFVTKVDTLVYPKTYLPLLQKMKYEIDLEVCQGEWNTADIQYPRITPKRTLVFNKLLEIEPVNIAIIWYRSGDGISHYHAHYTLRKDKILQWYEFLDTQVSKLPLDQFKDILIFSDHGVPVYGGMLLFKSQRIANESHREQGIFVNNIGETINHFKELNPLIISLAKEYNLKVDKGHKQYIYDKVEEEVIKERLRILGYID